MSIQVEVLLVLPLNFTLRNFLRWIQEGGVELSSGPQHESQRRTHVLEKISLHSSPSPTTQHLDGDQLLTPRQ